MQAFRQFFLQILFHAFQLFLLPEPILRIGQRYDYFAAGLQQRHKDLFDLRFLNPGRVSGKTVIHCVEPVADMGRSVTLPDQGQHFFPPLRHGIRLDAPGIENMIRRSVAGNDIFM